MIMSEEERAFFDRCDSFKNYATIDEYKADIRRWLTLSSWHYSEEAADALINLPASAEWIKQAFESGEPASSIGVDIGYGCG